MLEAQETEEDTKLPGELSTKMCLVFKKCRLKVEQILKEWKTNDSPNLRPTHGRQPTLSLIMVFCYAYRLESSVTFF